MEQMTQQEELRHEGDVRKCMDDLAYLIGLVARHPEIARVLDVEIHEIAERYTRQPMPVITVRVDVPLGLWSKYVGCYDALRTEEILLQGIEDVVAQHEKTNSCVSLAQQK